MNSSSLPYTVPDVDGDEVIQAGQVVLNSDMTYTVQGTGTFNGSDSQLVSDHGTYTHSGSHVTFTSEVIEGASYTATVTSTTLTATVPGGSSTRPTLRSRSSSRSRRHPAEPYGNAGVPFDAPAVLAHAG